jgi:hypothetical protein
VFLHQGANSLTKRDPTTMKKTLIMVGIALAFMTITSNAQAQDG